MLVADKKVSGRQAVHLCQHGRRERECRRSQSLHNAIEAIEGIRLARSNADGRRHGGNTDGRGDREDSERKKDLPAEWLSHLSWLEGDARRREARRQRCDFTGEVEYSTGRTRRKATLTL